MLHYVLCIVLLLLAYSVEHALGIVLKLIDQIEILLVNTSCCTGGVGGAMLVLSTF
jgi:hypothetical protein